MVLQAAEVCHRIAISSALGSPNTTSGTPYTAEVHVIPWIHLGGRERGGEEREREICIYQGEGVIRGVGRGVPSKTWKPNPLNQLLLQNRQCAVMLVKQHTVTCHSLKA